jgi:hypothetical protein
MRAHRPGITSPAHTNTNTPSNPSSRSTIPSPIPVTHVTSTVPIPSHSQTATNHPASHLTLPISVSNSHPAHLTSQSHSILPSQHFVAHATLATSHLTHQAHVDLPHVPANPHHDYQNLVVPAMVWHRDQSTNLHDVNLFYVPFLLRVIDALKLLHEFSFISFFFSSFSLSFSGLYQRQVAFRYTINAYLHLLNAFAILDL